METMSNKVWATYGLFKEYDEAKEKIDELSDEFDLYKIKRIREQNKKGWFRLKTWKQPTENKKNKKKKKAKKDGN